MEQAGSSELSLTPVISRLDRLEQMVYDLEEKHSLSGRYTSELSLTLPTEPGKECRPLESVLEEVPVKGSLVERVASLKHRVLKLSVQLEEERLRLKPAILPTPKDCTCNSTAKKKENGLKSISEEDHQEMHVEKAIEDECSRSSLGCRTSRRRIHHPIVRKRKWLGWLQLGC